MKTLVNMAPTDFSWLVHYTLFAAQLFSLVLKLLSPLQFKIIIMYSHCHFCLVTEWFFSIFIVVTGSTENRFLSGLFNIFSLVQEEYAAVFLVIGAHKDCQKRFIWLTRLGDMQPCWDMARQTKTILGCVEYINMGMLIYSVIEAVKIKIHFKYTGLL